MIISAQEADNFIGSVSGIAGNDPFACRIISLYNSYKPELVFVDYWLLADDEGEISGAIARNGSNFIMFLTDKSDIEEVSSFMRVAGASGVICDGRYELDLFGCRSVDGVVLIRVEGYDGDDDGMSFVEPDIKSAYELIVKSADENFVPPAFEDFYVDVNHKLRHKAMRLYGIEDDGALTAVAMTVAESNSGAVLGAVSTDPKYRNRGYGSSLIKYITNRLAEENKAVFLHRAKNANAAFYQNLGFEEFGTWREYYL